MTDQEDYITSTEARELLGVSKGKMTAMIRNGEIPVYPDPVDKRVKLIKRADVDAWLAKMLRRPRKLKQSEAEDDAEKIDRAA